MILLLFFLALLLGAVSHTPIFALTAVADAVGNFLVDVLSRLALAAFVTALPLVVRSIALGRHQGSR